ncbi:hypothetical protein N7470_008500 [Penicillium chermesinum]|nr:hypothetical protein N7470_008500 [Penicillium chermesinum]
MFSVVVPGRPCLTDIVAVDSQPNGQATKFAFSIPANPPFTDLVVFLLPGTVFPPDTGAAIYIQTPDPSGSPTDFRFIGALANEKPSGIFPVQSPLPTPNGAPSTEAEQEDEMLDEGAAAGAAANAVITLGISIEPAQNIAPQLAALEEDASQKGALVRVPQGQAQQKQISTKVLAQRVIGNAFNFLASFAESDPKKQGHEVVSLKSFRDWWAKFERRIDMDPDVLGEGGS